MGTTINIAVYLNENLNDKFNKLNKEKQNKLREKAREMFKEELK